LNDIKNKFINFEVESAELIDENPDSRFMTAKIQAFSSGRNRHDLICTETVLEKTAASIYNVPVIYNIVKSVNDFGSHTDPDKSLIAGFVVPNSAQFQKLEDGRTALFVLSKISKRYAPKVIEILKREEGQSRVSVEMELTEAEEHEDGRTEMLGFIYLAICLLGAGIREASPGAHIEVLSFAEENKKYQEDYLLEFSNKYAGIDLTIPKEIRGNANKGLELYRSLGIGGTSVSLAVARHISKNEVVAMDKIKAIHKFLNSRKGVPRNKNQPDAEHISWLLHGGNNAVEWSRNIVTAINEIDSKQLSYFEAKEEISVNEKDVEKKEEMAVEEPKVEEEKMEEPKTEEMAEEKPEEEAKEESPAEEKQEEEKKDEPEAEKKEMSLDANLDMAAFMALLAEETEAYTALVAKHQAGVELDHAAVYSMAYQKMCKMAEDLKKAQEDKDAYMAVNDDLKKFKADVEARQFAFEIETTLSEVSEVLSKEDVNQARENSKNYSLENIAGWKNEVKAMAFSANKDSKKPDDGINRFANSWVPTKKDSKLENGWV